MPGEADRHHNAFHPGYRAEKAGIVHGVTVGADGDTHRIRNQPWEVLRDPGSYGIEVLWIPREGYAIDSTSSR